MSDKNQDAVITELEKQVGELSQKLDAALKNGGADKIAALQKQLETQKAALDAAEDALALAKAKADMSDEEKEAFEDMKDEEDKKKFLALVPEDRKKFVADLKKGDETITVDGLTIRKSQVGDAQFAVIKSQQARIAASEAEIVKQREAAETAEISKRVDEVMKNLPGETDAKVAALKAVSKLPESVQKTLNTMLEAGDKAIKAAFSTIGKHAGKDPSQVEKAQAFERHVAEIAKRDNLSRAAALTKARHEYPAEFAAFQENGSTAN